MVGALFKSALIYCFPFMVGGVLHFVYPAVGDGLLCGLFSVALPILGELTSLISFQF